MKESTRLNIAAKCLFAASQFNDFSIQATVAAPADEHIGALIGPDSELHRQYVGGLISAYEYAINVNRIVLEIDARIQQYREREQLAKEGKPAEIDEVTGLPIVAFIRVAA